MAVALNRVPLLQCERLSLHHDGGAVKALDDVSLHIDEGEFVAITGPSGCGKSSLLSLIGALEVPTCGKLRYRGQAYTEMHDHALFRRARFGFVFQSFCLIPTLTALENVLLPTVGCPGSTQAHKRHAIGLMSALNLQERLGHQPNSLSGGERQRVAIARALINSPDVILADEPTGSLDSASAQQVIQLLETLRTDRRLTLVLVTHDLQLAVRADRRVALKDGRVVTTTESPSEPV